MEYCGKRWWIEHTNNMTNLLPLGWSVILCDPVFLPCLFCNTWSSVCPPPLSGGLGAAIWMEWSHCFLGDSTALLHFACSDPGVLQAPFRTVVTSCCSSWVLFWDSTGCREAGQPPTTGELHVVRGRPRYLCRLTRSTPQQHRTSGKIRNPSILTASLVLICYNYKITIKMY